MRFLGPPGLSLLLARPGPAVPEEGEATGTALLEIHGDPVLDR